jgi:hypothetical protein
VAEMAAKAHEISMEAGSKMAAAMKEVIGAAAGLSVFTLESARDLVQYMVRRGQMTQDEADKLIRDAEDAWSKKHKGKKPPPRVEKPKSILKPVPYSLPRTTPIAPPPAHASHTAHAAHRPAAPAKHAPAKHAPAKHAPAKHAPAKHAPAKSAHKPAKKAAKPAAKKPAAKKPAHKKAARPAAKKRPAPKK